MVEVLGERDPPRRILLPPDRFCIYGWPSIGPVMTAMAFNLVATSKVALVSVCIAIRQTALVLAAKGSCTGE